MGQHHHHPKGPALLWTVLLNIIITVAEYVGGIMTGSVALISDAGHNLSDVISLIIAYFGERISHSKAGPKSSFGLRRVEVITAMLNALALWGIAGYILFEAYQRFISPVEVASLPMLLIAFVGLGGNVASILILRRTAHHTLNIRAATIHLFSDAISSVGVVVGALLIMATGWSVFDLIVSIIIALFILFSGFSVIREAGRILMEFAPAGIDIITVRNAIQEQKGVASVHDLHVWSIGSDDIVLSCHVCICKEVDTDGLLKRMKKMLDKEFSISHTTVQVEKDDLCKGNGACN
ncbi:MAG: cation diffusion facilitator family transporter [archaeon]